MIESVSTIPDECMEVGLEIGTSDVLGNEASENRSGRQCILIYIDDIVSAIGNNRETRAEQQMGMISIMMKGLILKQKMEEEIFVQ